ncbi:putative oxidoreductase CzcO [Emticicia aquatica]|uniref:Oxidoreductase CzcO n=1 Tax=Emticicia aquatica TaxID=1681835 RepID=A0ABN8EQX0_9BACT|nr:NAD(P)/FAD-dependent oxidoreductase [Emticicia aquatica]CAH0995289.1 putative oxidoreductase CzcO [Emticicia aquatica]
MSYHKNIIIGAGPSGLAIAGRFTKLGIPYILLEKSENVGIEWRKHYDRLHLHTDKLHSALPHLPFPDSYPTFISKLQYIDYLESYIQHFGIKPNYKQEVIEIEKVENIWRVKTKTDEFFTENVIVSTGYNRVPKIPHFINDSLFDGDFIHSNSYSNGKTFAGKNVLVVGYGNSGAEIALDLFENGAKTYVSIRNPINIVNRDFMGRSTQGLAIFLSKFGNKFYDFVSKIFKKLSTGSMEGTGIPISNLAPSEQLRTLGKVPVIDVGTLEQIKAKNITVLPDIQEFANDYVVFVDGQKVNIDFVILATGYHAHLEKIVKNIPPLLNDRGYPKEMWNDSPAFKGLFFLGFNLPLTGILRDINLSSAKIAQKIANS